MEVYTLTSNVLRQKDISRTKLTRWGCDLGDTLTQLLLYNLSSFQTDLETSKQPDAPHTESDHDIRRNIKAEVSANGLDMFWGELWRYCTKDVGVASQREKAQRCVDVGKENMKTVWVTIEEEQGRESWRHDERWSAVVTPKRSRRKKKKVLWFG